MNRTELLAVAKPILFNQEMVGAILDGRKSATRRVVKKYQHAYSISVDDNIASACFINIGGSRIIDITLPYRKGDILYVRETWNQYKKRVGKGEACHTEVFYGYKASPACSEVYNEKWRPSIHMPKQAARIFLNVTDVRVEHLQDITEEQAIKEGVQRHNDGWKSYDVIKEGKHKGEAHPWNIAPYRSAKFSFQSLWDSLTTNEDLEKYGWNANPWVFVYEFERIALTEK